MATASPEGMETMGAVFRPVRVGARLLSELRFWRATLHINQSGKGKVEKDIV